MADPFSEDPALVHHVDLAVPGTHVVVIGIGQYDHLPGGSGTPMKRDLKLGQLTSPPVSARKIATWFIDNFTCSESPLGSLSLVLSEMEPASFKNNKTGVTYQVPAGTMEEGREALKRWIERASVTPKSRTIFYFCGHGLSKGLNNFYLFRDFGKDREDPFLGALNYRQFLGGLATRKPSCQFFLFDACRLADPIADWNSDSGERVFAADPEGRLGITEQMQQCPIFSTELDRRALGKPNEESLCARAFIRAMSGACCRREDNEWYVTTHRMVEALSDFQEREVRKAREEHSDNAELLATIMKQSADANAYAKIRLRKLAGSPLIPAFVRLDKQTLASKVKISALHSARQPIVISDPTIAGWSETKEWEVLLEIGEYTFKAEHVLLGNESTSRIDTVSPTHIDVAPLEVSRWA